MQFAAKQGSSASCGCPQTGSSTVTIEGVGAVRVGRDHATGKIQGGIATITVNGFPIATAGDPIDGHLHGFHNVDPRTANAARTVTVGRSDLASRSCANPVGKGGCIDFQSVERTEAITGQDGVHVQQTQPVSREDVDRHAVAASNHRPVVINVRKVSASGVVDPRAIKVFFTHGSFNISSSKAQYLLENVLTALGDTHGKPPVTSISVFNMCFQAQNYDSLNPGAGKARQARVAALGRRHHLQLPPWTRLAAADREAELAGATSDLEQGPARHRDAVYVDTRSYPVSRYGRLERGQRLRLRGQRRDRPVSLKRPAQRRARLARVSPASGAGASTGSGMTEVYVLSVASSYQGFSQGGSSAFGRADSTRDFFLNSARGLVGVKRGLTGSHSTEVHIADIP